MPSYHVRAYLFDNKPHLLSPGVGVWLAQSKRFTTFADMYRDKIRKKLRDTRDREAIRDLWCELETAYWLSQERRLTVEYEKCAAGGARCPDFTVTYTTSYAVAVEVTRVRGTTGPPLTPDANETGFIGHIAEKLRQMQPGMINVVWVVMEAAGGSVDLATAMTRLRERAEQKDPLIIGRHDLADTSEFFKYFQRLSGVVLRVVQDRDASRFQALWTNPQAKHPLPSAFKTVLQGLS